jgi:glycosyltransferase involved in cell wall biosynthesis
MTDLSVVVPAYNEAGSIERLVRDLARDVVPLAPDVEVIVVDDVSTDETPLILDRLAQELPWLHVHRPAQNGGHGRAVIRGLDLARADWVFQIDSDGQFVVADLARLWTRRDECDVALGVRTERRDPAHRLVLSFLVAIATSVLAGRRLTDANTPFRLVRRDVWADLRPLVADETAAPNIFVTVGASVRGWRMVEVPVTHLPRDTGTVSLRALKLIGFSARGLAELVRFRAALARAAPRDGTATP